MKKKILVFTPHFHPENQILNDLIFSLKNEYYFTVITSFPHYPRRDLFKSYKLFQNSIEYKNKIKIIRLPLSPRVGKNLFFLSLNYLSYIVMSLLLLPYLLFKNFDRIFIFQTSPVTIGLAPLFLSRVKNIKSSIWILDLWPETLESFSFPFKKLIIKLIGYFSNFIYKNNEIVLISSNGFRKILERRKIDPKKIFHIPQWVSNDQYQELKKTNYPNIADSSFKITFAGNIGDAQDIESIINCIKLTEKLINIHWIFIGEGSSTKLLKNYLEKSKSKNVHLLGSYPKKYMNYFFSKSNALLISLKKSPAFSLVIPGKLQSYMFSGKPILTMASGEVSRIIEDFKIGLTAESGDYLQLKNNILNLMKYDESKISFIKNNSRLQLQENFDKNKIIEKIKNLCF